MTDNTVTHTSARHTRDAYVEKSSGSGALWFIVGGLVVAVAVALFLLNGGEVAAPAGGDVSVTVEGSDTATTQSAPAAAPAATESAAPEATGGAEATATTDGG